MKKRTPKVAPLSLTPEQRQERCITAIKQALVVHGCEIQIAERSFYLNGQKQGAFEFTVLARPQA